MPALLWRKVCTHPPLAAREAGSKQPHQVEADSIAQEALGGWVRRAAANERLAATSAQLSVARCSSAGGEWQAARGFTSLLQLRVQCKGGSRQPLLSPVLLALHSLGIRQYISQPSPSPLLSPSFPLCSLAIRY